MTDLREPVQSDDNGSQLAERAAVIKWLRRMAANARHWGGEDNIRAEIYDRLVDVFECGEHHPEAELIEISGQTHDSE